MKSPVKLILLLVGIYAAGVLSGVFLDRRINLTPPNKAHRSTVAVEQWAPKQLKRVAEGLDLEPAQAELIRPIVRRYMEELDRLRSYSRSETSGIFERMEREIGEKLTPEQRAKYEQMNKETRERMKNEPRPGEGPKGGRPKEGDMPPPPPPEKSADEKK